MVPAFEEKAEISRYSEDMGLPYEFIRFSRYLIGD